MIKKYTLTIILLISCFFPSFISHSQNLSGTINSYAQVTNISSSQFTIGNISGDANEFAAGKKVLIYQAKGASINTSDSNQFGQVINLGNAGRYEFASVSSKSGNVVTFSSLLNVYDVAGEVQLVSVPKYTLANTNVTGELTAQSWNKSLGYGGILILEANKLTLKANINVDGKGFVGGNRSSNNSNGCVTVYRSTNSIYGEKGEGVTTHSTYTRGQGPLANGGGGASTHNGGGGGGSNHGKGSQGGIGWSCNSDSNAGGLGGTLLSYTSSTQRLFFGGGGGGGQQNNSKGSLGGNGGGIVFLLIDELTTDCAGTHVISAKGINSGNVGNDGAGGAGAGGVIYIHTKTYNPNTCNIDLNVDGGSGGNVTDGNVHGGGGGGGSGLIYSSIAFVSGINVSGSNGTDGTDNSGGNNSGENGIDKPIDVVVNPITPPGADPVVGPGGHTSGLKMWLKADASKLFSNVDLNLTITNGEELKSWTNDADPNNHINLEGANSHATFLNSSNDLLNFNSIVRLNNTNRNLRSIKDIQAQTIVVVSKTNTDTYLAGVVGIDGDLGIRLSTDANVWRSSNSNDWSNGGEGFINGLSGFIHNKKWHFTYQEKGVPYIDNLYVGGYYSDRAYSGDIAEVIAYDDRLDDAEQQNVESYLALKYGITLEGKDYKFANTTIWRRSDNTAYNNDIAGIGRDNISALLQSKSKSINEDALVTIQAESALDNNDFFVWGNNNAVLNNRNTVDIPATWGERLERIWKVRKTNSPGTFRVSFDLSALGISYPSIDSYVLLHSSNTTFATATEHLTGKVLNATNTEISFTGLSLNDGDYFTLITKKKAAPGGDITNLEFWLKADAGTETAVDGGTVATWNDQLESNHAIQLGSTALPIYHTDRLNFNPVMDYSSTANQVYTISDSEDINQIVSTLEKAFSMVFKTGSDVTSRQVLYEEGGASRGVNAYLNNGELYIGAWNKASDGVGDNWGFLSEKISVQANTCYLLTFNMQGNDEKTGQIELINKGKIERTISTVGRLYAHGADIGIGGMVNASYFESPTDSGSDNGYYFKGVFAEISYSKEYLNATKRNKIESYLAIKYGLTLDQSNAQNYMASDAVVVWPASANSSYSNDVVGVAKDDDTELNQLKSKSVNLSAILTLANGSDFNSPTNFIADRSYLIMGHNGGDTDNLTGDYLGKSNNGIERIWKVSERNNVGDVTLSITNSNLPSGATHILVSSNPSFPASSTTSKILATGTKRLVTYNFSNGDYFTFGKINTAPVLTNLESTALNYCSSESGITGTIIVADEDADNIRAIIEISTGFQTGEDTLLYTLGTGVTTVSQTANRIELLGNLSNIQNALRQIRYRNNFNDGSRTTANRVVRIILNDGTVNSNQLTRIIKPGLIPAPHGVFY